MPKQLGIRVRDYYDITPALENTPGDIWTGLPTFGLLGNSALPGIVITPACDLSNRKVETITYLPIVPVRAYFATPAYIPEIIREVEGQLQSAEMASLISSLTRPGRFLPPSLDALTKLDKEIDTTSNSTRLGEKAKTALQRARAGIRLLQQVATPEIVEASLQDLKLLLGEKAFRSTLERVVGNSYRLDIHFLPADEQDSAWSGVRTHSVTLFRYAFSAPVEIFECAQDIQLSNWRAEIQRLSGFIPGITAFSRERPMKRVSLKPRFVADLLTRYVAMHVRLGSPDFTQPTVAQYVSQIGEC